MVNPRHYLHVRPNGTVYAANGSARDGVSLPAKATVASATAATSTCAPSFTSARVLLAHQP